MVSVLLKSILQIGLFIVYASALCLPCLNPSKILADLQQQEAEELAARGVEQAHRGLSSLKINNPTHDAIWIAGAALSVTWDLSDEPKRDSCLCDSRWRQGETGSRPQDVPRLVKLSAALPPLRTSFGIILRSPGWHCDLQFSKSQ